MSSSTTPTTRHKPLRFGVVLGVCVFGLLFWARLIVVSDMPRTAIADEDERPAPTVEAPSDRNPLPGETPGERGSIDLDAVRHDASSSANASISDFGPEAEKSAAQVTEDRD